MIGSLRGTVARLVKKICLAAATSGARPSSSRHRAILLSILRGINLALRVGKPLGGQEVQLSSPHRKYQSP